MDDIVTTSLSEYAASGRRHARGTWYGGERMIHLEAQMTLFDTDIRDLIDQSQLRLRNKLVYARVTMAMGCG